MNLGLLAVAVVLAALCAGVGVGLVKFARGGARGAVAAAPETPRGRLADVIEENANLRADMKSLRREWEDFERSWTKRWGTVTRGMRRDEANAEAAAAAAGAADPDPAQLEFTVPHAAPSAEGQRRRLQPVRMLGRSG